VPDIASVGSGEAGASVDGQPVTPEVIDDDGSIVVSVGDATVRYSVVDSSGTSRPIASSAAVELTPGDTVTIEMSGFALNAVASVWLTPGDTELGSTNLSGGKGSFSAVVPDGDTTGARRIVVASQSTDNKPVVVAYGVDVASTGGSGTSWSPVLLVIVGIAVMLGLFIPAARRRRDSETSEIG
jgi:hypothetical protein